MGVDKREILYQLVKKELWEKLSPGEIRLYLLFVVAVDKKRGKGKLSLEEINLYLKLNLDELKKKLKSLQKLNLIKAKFCEKHSVQFQILPPAPDKQAK